MSSVQLFILDELERGEAYGYQLGARARADRTQLWTRVGNSPVYSALKALRRHGLIEAVPTDTTDTRPDRIRYAITEPGRAALLQLRDNGLRPAVLRVDPFDAALVRAGPLSVGELRNLVVRRHADYTAQHTALTGQLHAPGGLAGDLSPIEWHVVNHRLARLATEITWHEELLTDLTHLTDLTDLIDVTDPADRNGRAGTPRSADRDDDRDRPAALDAVLP